MVRWAWGSRSTRRTRRPRSARAAPRLTVVVVLPTPPFWFMRAMVRMGSVLCPWSFVARGGAQLGRDRTASIDFGSAGRATLADLSPTIHPGPEGNPMSDHKGQGTSDQGPRTPTVLIIRDGWGFNPHP